LTGNIVCGGGTKKSDHPGDILGLAEALEGDFFQ